MFPLTCRRLGTANVGAAVGAVHVIPETVMSPDSVVHEPSILEAEAKPASSVIIAVVEHCASAKYCSVSFPCRSNRQKATYK